MPSSPLSAGNRTRTPRPCGTVILFRKPQQVRVVVRDVRGVPVFAVPHPAVELIHPMSAVLDGRAGVPVRFFRIFAEHERSFSAPESDRQALRS